MPRHNPRLAKIHRTYTVEEVAHLYRVHKNTVRKWIKRGLPLLDKTRPMLILGKDLKKFIEDQRKKHKKPCKLYEIYCLRCREPRQPAGHIASYKPLTETQGNLIGICPVCETFMFKIVSLSKLEIAKCTLQIQPPQGLEHLKGTSVPPVNSDFNLRGKTV